MSMMKVAIFLNCEAFIQTLDVHNRGYITLEDIEERIKEFHVTV